MRHLALGTVAGPAQAHAVRAGLVQAPSGAVVGCWTWNCLGLSSSADAIPAPGMGVAHVARRVAGDVRSWVADRDTVPGDLSPASLGAMRRVPFESFVEHVGRLSSAFGFVVRNRLVRLGHPDDRSTETAVEACRVAMRAAVATVSPFLDTLDPAALGEVKAIPGYGYGATLDTYRLLDGTCGHGAPLAVAFGWLPRMRREVVGHAAGDPDGFAVAVSCGRDGYGAALARHLSSQGRLGMRGARMALAVSDAAAGMTRARGARMLATPRLASDRPGAMPEDRGVEDVAWCLERLPPSCAPRDAVDWTAFDAVLPAVVRCVERAPEGKAWRMLGRGGDWPSFEARLRAACGKGRWPRRLHGALWDADDMASWLGERVALPAWLMAQAGGEPPSRERTWAAGRRILSDGRGIARSLAMGDSWRMRRAAMDEALPPMGDGDAARGPDWPAVLPDAVVDGHRIIVLAGERDLREEGFRGPDRHGVPGLAHCSGSYVRGCREGLVRFLSVRAPDGRRLSTADVEWRDGRARLVDHHGRDNARPSAGAVAVVEAYMARLGRGDLQASAPALSAVGAPASPMARCGYDWTVPGAWEDAASTWAPFLSRPARWATPAQVASAVPDGEPGAPAWGERAWDPRRTPG